MYVMNKYDKIGDKSQAPEVFKKISSLQTDLKQALNNELSPLKEFASKINSEK